MGKPEAVTAPQALPAPHPTIKACALERRDGKWAIIELTIASGRVTATRTVGSEYYRDLAEDQAMRWLRRAGR